MANEKDPFLVIDDLRGGLNTSDAALALDPRQVVAAVNVHWDQATVAKKRAGSAELATAARPAEVTVIRRLLRHTPSADESAAELWLLGNGTTPAQRVVPGAAPTWQPVTLPLAPTSMNDSDGASFNGKLFLAYQGASDRLVVFDGVAARVVGFATPAAPTVANTGSGSYAATARSYKVAYLARGGYTGAVIDLGPLHFWQFVSSGTVAAPTVGALTLPLEADGAWASGYATGGAGGSLYRDNTVSADLAAAQTGINSTLDGALSMSVSFFLAKSSASALPTATTIVRTGAINDATSGWRVDSDFTTATSLRLTVGNGTTRQSLTVAAQLVADSAWHHYVAVINRTTSQLHLYVDGVSVGSAALTISGSFTSGGDALSVLAIDQCNLDELAIWNRALSATEVAAIYARRNEVEDIRRRSELSDAVAFTPSGSGTAARVTRPALLGEAETHWELYASADAANFFKITEQPIGQTTYDDTTAPSAYTGEVPPAVGWNLPPGAAKYLLVDENRLLLAGSWQTVSKQSRVEFTPVVGASDIGDDERVPLTTALKYWVDLDPMDGGGITGMGGPLFGNPIVFKRSQIWKLLRTGVVNAPYQPIPLSKEIGCVAHQSIVLAEDEDGSPCLYWLSSRGPYRMGARGFQYLGRDIETLWDTANPAASVPAHGVFFTARKQVWWWFAPTGSDTPSVLLVFDVRLGRSEGAGVRGGWSQYTGELAFQFCSAMWPTTLGATMGLTLAPHGSGSSVANAPMIVRMDTGTTDWSRVGVATAYQAYVKTKPFLLAGPMRNAGITETQILAKAATGVTLRVTLDRDFGAQVRTGDVSLTAVGTETRVIKKVEDVEMTAAHALQVQVGDAAAVSSAWTVDALQLRLRQEEVR